MRRREFVKAALALPIGLAMARTGFAASRTPTNKVLFIGDSIFAVGNTGTFRNGRQYLSHNSTGEIIWAWMADPRYQLDVWLVPGGRQGSKWLLTDGANQGIIGTTTRRLGKAAEIDHVRSMDPDVVIVGFGANDIPGGIPFAQYSEAVAGFCDKMGSDGRHVVVATIRPHVQTNAKWDNYNYASGSPMWDEHFKINNWILNDLPKIFPGAVTPWDTFAPLADPSSYRGGIFLPGVSRDGVHLNEIGAFNSGMTLVPVMQKLFADGTFFNADPHVGNLLPNPDLVGGAGTAGAGVSGAVPDHVRFSTRSRKPAQLKLAQAEGELTLDFQSKQDGVPLETVYATLFDGDSIAVENGGGRKFQLMVRVESAASPRLRSISALLTDDKGFAQVEALRPQSHGSPLWPNAPFSGWLITPVIELPDEAAGLRPSINIQLAAGDEPVSITLSKPILRAV